MNLLLGHPVVKTDHRLRERRGRSSLTITLNHLTNYCRVIEDVSRAQQFCIRALTLANDSLDRIIVEASTATDLLSFYSGRYLSRWR